MYRRNAKQSLTISSEWRLTLFSAQYSLLVREGPLNKLYRLFKLRCIVEAEIANFLRFIAWLVNNQGRGPFHQTTPNNKIITLFQAKHVLMVSHAIPWIYVTSLKRNECWQNSWWEDNALRWLFKRLFAPLRSRWIFFKFSLSSYPVFPCPSHQHSSVWFLRGRWGVFHTSPGYLTTCDHLVFTLALLDTSSKHFLLRYLCFLLVPPFRPRYIPRIFPVRCVPPSAVRSLFRSFVKTLVPRVCLLSRARPNSVWSQVTKVIQTTKWSTCFQKSLSYNSP